MKTFEDLQFKEHASVQAYRNIGVEKHTTHAVMNFPNGYGISVICERIFIPTGRMNTKSQYYRKAAYATAHR